jgi:hypothetical protein
MKTYFIIFLNFWLFSVLSARAGGVEYVPIKSRESLVSPLEIEELCRETLTMFGVTNHSTTQETLVAWAIKKDDSDRPPVLHEEGIIFFQEVTDQTNRWVLAVIERSLARGRAGSEQWRLGISSKGSMLVHLSVRRPTVQDITEFTRSSNFGYNELSPDIIPIHVTVYAPFGEMVAVVSKSLSKAERQRRSRSSPTIISDPSPK